MSGIGGVVEQFEPGKQRPNDAAGCGVEHSSSGKHEAWLGAGETGTRARGELRLRLGLADSATAQHDGSQLPSFVSFLSRSAEDGEQGERANGERYFSEFCSIF